MKWEKLEEEKENHTKRNTGKFERREFCCTRWNKEKNGRWEFCLISFHKGLFFIFFVCKTCKHKSHLLHAHSRPQLWTKYTQLWLLFCSKLYENDHTFLLLANLQIVNHFCIWVFAKNPEWVWCSCQHQVFWWYMWEHVQTKGDSMFLMKTIAYSCLTMKKRCFCWEKLHNYWPSSAWHLHALVWKIQQQTKVKKGIHFQCTEKCTVSQLFNVQIVYLKNMTVHFWGAMCGGDLCFAGMIKKWKVFILNDHRGEKEANFLISFNHSAKHIFVISGTKIDCRGEIMNTKLL